VPEHSVVTPDHNLLERMARGEQDAVIELRRRHGESMYALAYALIGDSLDADQVVRDTFAEALLAAPRYDRRQSTVFSWLAGIARHRAGGHD